MTKKKIILVIVLIVLIIAGTATGFIIFKNKKEENITLNNIEGTYSDVIITDFASAKKSLEDVKKLLPISSVTEDLEDGISTEDDVLKTYKMTQKYQGIKVYYSDIIVYTDKVGNAVGAINNLKDLSNLDTTLVNDIKDLEKVALDAIEDENAQIISEEEVIYPKEDKYYVAYEYQIEKDLEKVRVIVSDKNKEVLDIIDGSYDIDTSKLEEFVPDKEGREYLTNKGWIDSSNQNNKYFLYDNKRHIVATTMLYSPQLALEIYTWNENNDMVLSQISLGLDSLNTTIQVYEYYKERFNYLSLDGNNKAYVTLINGVDDTKDSRRKDNAIYEEGLNYILLGKLNYYNKDVEVLGHEYTHGIFYYLVGSTPENRKIAKAVNEAYADIMGMCIEAYYNGSDNIDGFINQSGDGVKRDITKTKNVYKYDKKNYNLTGEEHDDSTIISRAAYNMSKSLILEEFEELWFKSLKLLPSLPDFFDVKYAVIRNAQLMNLSRKKIDAIEQAFVDVGIKNIPVVEYGYESKYDLKGITFPDNDVKAEYADPKIVLNPELEGTVAFGRTNNTIVAIKEDGSLVPILENDKNSNGDYYYNYIYYSDGCIYLSKAFAKATPGKDIPNYPVNSQEVTVTGHNYFKIDLTKGDGNYEVESVYSYTPTLKTAIIKEPYVYKNILYVVKDANVLVKVNLQTQEKEEIHRFDYQGHISLAIDSDNGLLYYMGYKTGTEKEMYVYDMNKNTKNKIEVEDLNTLGEVNKEGIYINGFDNDTYLPKYYFYDVKSQKVTGLPIDDGLMNAGDIIHKNGKIYYLEYKDMNEAALHVIDNGNNKLLKDDIEFLGTNSGLKTYGDKLQLIIGDNESYLIDPSTDELVRQEQVIDDIIYIKK